MKSKLLHTGIGLMSGSSLDGLDLACCEFEESGELFRYRLLASETIPYPASLRNQLESASSKSVSELLDLDHSLGKYYGQWCMDFISRRKIAPGFVASHGHTILHRPEKGYSLQIGNGHDLAAATGLTVVYDFRSMDVAKGGQGAPLVPVGDRYLFGEYDICLNLGGFSNLSYESQGIRLAMDICPVNTILNHYASSLGFDYDLNGQAGRRGKVIPELLKKLNSLRFYRMKPPKSLGADFNTQMVFPLLEESGTDVYNILRTWYEHASFQISEVLNQLDGSSVLITGGGAKNQFLMELLEKQCRKDLVIPDEGIVDFKEAIIFAFLGYLKLKGRVNVFGSVTGAGSDSSSGIIIQV